MSKIEFNYTGNYNYQSHPADTSQYQTQPNDLNERFKIGRLNLDYLKSPAGVLRIILVVRFLFLFFI